MKAEIEKQILKAEDAELEQSSLGPSALSVMLKIGFDGKRATNNLTGLGNYSRALIENLAVNYPNNKYLVYTPKVRADFRIQTFVLNGQVKIKTPKASSFLWRSFGVLKDIIGDGVTIYHGLSQELPFAINQTKIRTVVTIHDLIFLRFPKYYSFLNRNIYRFKSKNACENADVIVAISGKTKADIISYYGIDEHKIRVIYQTCDDIFKTTASSNTLKQVASNYKLPSKYLLSVGTIEERKNLVCLIKALPYLGNEIELIVIGKETKYKKEVLAEINDLGLSQRVKFLENVPFEDLPSIYQLSTIFIYPSRYEGFGIPIIEALFSKTPVIAASGSCLEEAGGPNSLYFDPNDELMLAEAINKVLDSSALRQEMIENGLLYAEKFNKNKITAALMDTYVNLNKISK